MRPYLSLLPVVFYFFKLHDFDGNDKLDGLELMAMLTDYQLSSAAESHSPHQFTVNQTAQQAAEQLQVEQARQDAESQRQRAERKVSGTKQENGQDHRTDEITETTFVSDPPGHGTAEKPADQTFSSDSPGGGGVQPFKGLLVEEEVAPAVDSILAEHDFNGDGFLTFAEFASNGIRGGEDGMF